MIDSSSTLQTLETYLSTASVSPSIFTLRPDYRVLLLAISGITPSPSDSTSETLLQSAEKAATETLKSKPVTEIPHIAAWREAYKSFGSKPQKSRNSLEALTRRVDVKSGTGLPRVNRLTDVYNAVSVMFQIPLGGEDLDRYVGPPRCVRADGTEKFVTTVKGVEVVEYPDVGEVVWCDDEGVTCRRWNWRQGPRTALTDETKRALFILDFLEPIGEETLEEAVKMLVEGLGEGVIVARRLIKKE